MRYPQMRNVAVFLACLTMIGGVPAAQEAQPPAQRAEGVLKADATAIAVDVVVRDRRGQPVLDLGPDDFQIFEDGVLQEIGSVTLYASEPARASGAPAGSARASAEIPAVPAEAPPTPVLALVFDRLSPEARALAHKAALRYIGDADESQALVGVFGIDLSLRTYQAYTRDSAQLRRAVEAIGNRSTSQFGSSGAQGREAGEAASRAADAQATAEAGAGPGGTQGGIGAAASEAMFAEMQRRMVETFDALERDQQGYATSNSLLALVNSMRTLPGRKSVVFFSEGLAIPTNVAAQFRSVIDTANRANVSIYAMDAAGLRTESTTQEARDNINAAANRMLRRNPSADVVGGAMTAGLERNEDWLRHDPHSGLGQLTSETGGLLIRNTNDLTSGFRRVDEDMRNYYMLTYVPRNDDFDGGFRTIAVTVDRRDVEVASRKGYYAVRTPGAQPIMSFEAPALAMLESTPVPNAFPVRAAALHFPEPERPGLVPIVVTFPAGHLRFHLSDDKSTYRGDFTVLVRLRDGADQIVRKMSQHFELTGPADRLDWVRQGDVLFYREADLDPDLYTMETVVYDGLADRASVRFSTVEQPKPDTTALRVSNLVLVERSERLPDGERPSGSPFLVGDLLLYPDLQQAVRKGEQGDLGFFFTVYPRAQGKVTATLQVIQRGAALAQLPLPLGEADAAGRIQHVSRIPIDAFPPGTYELRVIVTDGTEQHVRSVTVRIME
jgi:VWFA-related protein